VVISARLRVMNLEGLARESPTAGSREVKVAGAVLVLLKDVPAGDGRFIGDVGAELLQVRTPVARDFDRFEQNLHAAIVVGGQLTAGLDE